MLHLSKTIFDLVEATFPPGFRSLDEFRKDIVCSMRLLHYPPTPHFIPKDASTANSENNIIHSRNPQFGASANTDFNSITLLLQDEHEGLEVFDRTSQTWNLVPPNKDAYVVNLGDLMNKLTRGSYKNSLHRVINRNPNEDRSQKRRMCIIKDISTKMEDTLRNISTVTGNMRLNLTALKHLLNVRRRIH